MLIASCDVSQLDGQPLEVGGETVGGDLVEALS